MKQRAEQSHQYSGFEQGPIRPPSEAHSLLLRVTRNCPWNRCTFCPLYKDSKFSIRPVDHVLRDIDIIFSYVEIILNKENPRFTDNTYGSDQMAYIAAKRWITYGMTSIFLQDSNSMAIDPDDLIKILKHIKKRFPNSKRITSYARSSTINKIPLDNLKDIKSAGLNRIHIGLESGSDKVLKLVCKGANKQVHIDAGKKVKEANIELSEYVIPGLGGQLLSELHAEETADALNQINPDFIRLRPLALPSHIINNFPFSTTDFIKCTDPQIVDELHLLISQLKGITSILLSDHILNLFSDLQGTFPQDKNKMLLLLERFRKLPKEKQELYQLGRRMGIYSTLNELENPRFLSQVKLYFQQMKTMKKDINQITDELMQRYI